MLPGPPRRRRARPVADAPIDALLARAEDLAKGWLFALLEQMPLDEAPRVLAGDLSREGPRLCDATLRALSSDTDFRRLAPGGALEPLAARIGELAGASGPAAIATAVDALQGVVWAALRVEVRDAEPELATDLAERLAQVAELLRAAALGAVTGPRPTRPGLTVAAPTPAEGPAGATSTPADGPAADPRPREPGPAPEPPFPAAGTRPAPATVTPAPEPASSGLGREPWAWGGQPPEPPEALWIGALRDEIERAGDAHLSLLLAELEDADRVAAVEPEAEAASALGVFARGVRQVVRRQDILVAESDSRAWIIARETGRPGAHALGMRIAAAVRAGHPWRGAPLSVSVGVAVLGEDGTTPAELIDAAEQSRFAAAAAGLDVS